MVNKEIEVTANFAKSCPYSGRWCGGKLICPGTSGEYSSYKDLAKDCTGDIQACSHNVSRREISKGPHRHNKSKLAEVSRNTGKVIYEGLLDMPSENNS